MIAVNKENVFFIACFSQQIQAGGATEDRRLCLCFLSLSLLLSLSLSHSLTRVHMFSHTSPADWWMPQSEGAFTPSSSRTPSATSGLPPRAAFLQDSISGCIHQWTRHCWVYMKFQPSSMAAGGQLEHRVLQLIVCRTLTETWTFPSFSPWAPWTLALVCKWPKPPGQRHAVTTAEDGGSSVQRQHWPDRRRGCRRRTGLIDLAWTETRTASPPAGLFISNTQ